MGEVPSDPFDQEAFSASAAALVASHAMSDAIWKTYFPEIPAKQPELRTVLIKIHEDALAGRPLKVSAAHLAIATLFSIELNTAKKWIKQLQELGFLVKLKSSKKNAFFILPSTRAKTGLFHVGEEYLVCLRLVSHPLREAMNRTQVDVSDLDWLEKIKDLLEIEAHDYQTSDEGSQPLGVDIPPTTSGGSGETITFDEDRD